MNKLSYRFILSNIITSVLLVISSMVFGKSDGNAWEEQNILYGLFIYPVFLAGLFFGLVKARDLGNRITKKLSTFEVVFVFILYVFALGANAMMLFMANNLLYGGHQHIPRFIENITIGLMLLTFVVLIAEPILFSSLKKKHIGKRMLKWTDFFHGAYISIGIGVTWNVLVYNGKLRISFEQSDFWGELFALIVLAIMIILPFQRLFWYEVMAESNKKDSWKVFGSISLVIVAAILPLFLMGTS